ncbi:unnamed protein product [Nippostrongylus brasiliensis]|uniref:Glucose transporter type 1 (inferred by orthology to a D. melanogaster protein) n=1 Tax=Nippostrongylus brasiliensis TaxID=27835 RepID=A0A0N4YGB4_NIPBR|nr:unnamed protein product [Nippostrongylus brasiliensis]
MEDTAVYKNLLEESREPQKPSHSPPPRLLLSAVLVALGGPFNFGYQLLITNPSQEAFIQFLNRSHFLNRNEYLSREDLESQWSLVISIFFWGCTAGAFLIRVLSEKFGRKNSLQISHAIQIASCSLTVFSYYVSHVFLSISIFYDGTGSLFHFSYYFPPPSSKERRSVMLLSGLSYKLGNKIEGHASVVLNLYIHIFLPRWSVWC